MRLKRLFANFDLKLLKRISLVGSFITLATTLSFSQTIQSETRNSCSNYSDPNCAQLFIPVPTNSIYCYSQQIVNKNKIVDAGWSSEMEYITRVRYFINNPDYIGMTNSDNWGIYIGLTEKTSFDSISDWLSVSSMSLVFDGIVTHPQDSGWWDIILQTPFYYDGSQNLAIAIHEKTIGYTPTHTYYLSYTDTVNVGLIFNSQGGGAINPNPISPPAGVLKSNVPILQFYFEEECSSPANFKIDSLTATESHLSWTPMGSETLWNLRYKMTNSENWNVIENISTPFYSLADLFSIQSYIVQVQANCGAETSEWGNPIYFTTPPIPGMEYTVDWEIYKNQTAGDFSILDVIEPDMIVKLDSINTPNYSTSMDRFFSRIRGYIIPRTSGLYSFHFGVDDIGEFWLSTDEDESNSVLAINCDTITTELTQNQYFQDLIAGQKYFFEILQYDTVYTDFIRLGWIVPGDTIIKTLMKPFISTCGTNVISQGLDIISDPIIGYSGYQEMITFQTIPWNASDKRVVWESTDINIATVNTSGLVTLVDSGSCKIICKMLDNPIAADTIDVNVWTYNGPFYVKQDASTSGSGYSWNDPIDLQTLLGVLNKRISIDTIDILVSEGIYKPTETMDRNITFNIKNVRLFGGFSDLSQGTDTVLRDIETFETILSGDVNVALNNFDNSYHVVTASKYVVIDGVTISDGRASCSSYGWTPGFYQYKPEDNGGGIFIPGVRSYVLVNNCKIKNNSAWNSGAGVYCHRASINVNLSSDLIIQNSKVFDNIMQAEYIQSGQIFQIVVNTNGAGVAVTTSKFTSNNNLFYSNRSDFGYGKAIFLSGSLSTISNTTVFGNIGNYEDVWVKDGGSVIFNNSTFLGSLVVFFSNAEFYNSTIVGGGYYRLPVNGKVKFDNIIWTAPNLAASDQCFSDTAKCKITHSIIENVLYGQNNFDSIFVNIPQDSFWLDTLAYNGGSTPTMKLKNLEFNAARSYGNPLYLGTLDQRGALRQDSVSIGAYQWVNSTGIIGSHSALELCLGASYELYSEVLPEFVSVPEYYLTSTDSSIVNIEGNAIYALGEGDVNIIYKSLDGNHTDTCFVNVIGTVGVESINGPTEVCEGETSVIYTVNPIENATSYLWTLPDGATGVSDTNSIELNFGVVSSSGNLTVKGINSCFDGDVSLLPITVKQITSNALTETVCDSYTAPDGQVYNTSGIKTAIILNSAGCDSVITIDLNINYTPATPIITLQENILFSDSPNGNQWYDQNGLILGANEQDYLVTYDGDYFVIVTLLDCSSPSSNIINVTGTSAWVAEQNENVKVYPNPFTEELIIENEDNSVIVNFEILNSIGQIVCKGNLVEKIIIQTSDYAPGVYLLKLENGNHFEFKTIVKE